MAEKFTEIATGFAAIVAMLLVFVPLVSYGLSQAGIGTPLLGGPIFTVLLVAVMAIVLVSLVLKWGMPGQGQKWLFLYVALIIGTGIYLIIKLPSLIPGMYSTISNGVQVPFSLSPLMMGIIGFGILGLLYWYYKKK